MEGIKKIEYEFMHKIRHNGIFRLSVLFSDTLKNVIFQPSETELITSLHNQIMGQAKIAN